MANVPPVVRYLIVCEDCRADPANPRQISAMNIIGYFQPTPTGNYPLFLKEVVVAGMLTEGRGGVRFRLEIVKDFDPPIYRSADQSATFGADPLELCLLVFRIRNLIVPQPGLYEFRLICDDAVLAVQPVRAK
jgi:hypothetical protein